MAKDGKLGCSTCKKAGSLKIQRVHLANEWINCQIKSTADDRNKKMSALRGKIKQHLESQAHDMAMGICETSKRNCCKSRTISRYYRKVNDGKSAEDSILPGKVR